MGIAVWFRLLRPSRQRPSAYDSNFRSCKEEWPACYGRSGNGIPRPILIFVAAKKNSPTAADVAATSSVSVSNFPSSKEEWPACYDRRDNELPRPILIFAAAKKNGPTAADVAATSSASDSILRCCKEEWPACSGRGNNEFRVRFYSSLLQRRMASLQLA